MNSKEIDKIIDSTHRAIIDVEASVPAGINGNNNNSNPNHPRNWDNDRFFEYARRWIFEFAQMTEWQDNPKAGPQLKAYPDLYKKLASFPEPFLKECLRYRVTVERIDHWLKLTPEERYQEKKKNNIWHDTNVFMLYGNSYAAPDKPGCASDTGCIPECKYYEPTGSISDGEVLDWYRNEIGNRTYEQLRQENNLFIQEYVDLLRKQASALPTYAQISADYYPSLDDLNV